VIRQFDIPKAKEGEFVDMAMEELHELASDIKAEEVLTQANNTHGADDDKDDDLEGWVDEQGELSAWDLRELEGNVQPVRMTLVKLHKVAYAIKNSPTLILLKWFLTLDELGLGCHMMPQDVLTRWNSTYDMLVFTVKYQDVLNTVTGDCDMKLWWYEMDNTEWVIAQQLCEVLKVSYRYHINFLDLFTYPCIVCRFSRMLHFFSCVMLH
ncbi:hypothetical protein EDB87DRAFT_1571406, partial [Lactarius vividus]